MSSNLGIPPPSEPDSEVRNLLAACEVLAALLSNAGVSPAVLLECLYYATEEDLLRIMRLAAALEPAERVEAQTLLKAMWGGEVSPFDRAGARPS